MNERLHLVTHYHKNKPVWTRHYLTLPNVHARIARMVSERTDLHVGDKFEFSHLRSGKQLGVIKVTTQGSRSEMIYDKEVMWMHLISCDGCGVVFDKKKLNFPSDIWTEGDCIDYGKGVWNGDTHVPFVRCPVCDGQILDSEEG